MPGLYIEGVLESLQNLIAGRLPFEFLDLGSTFSREEDEDYDGMNLAGRYWSLNHPTNYSIQRRCLNLEIRVQDRNGHRNDEGEN